MDSLSILDWLAQRSPWWGITWVARKILSGMRGRVMWTPGFRFFATRDVLEKNSDFNEVLGSASHIDAVFVTGYKFKHRRDQNIRRIRRLILPDPAAPSFLFYEKSVGENAYVLANQVREATKICAEHGIKVKWSPILIQQSFLIGNAGQSNSWVHIELVLPFSTKNIRPSMRIQNSRFETLVVSYVEIFEKLWEASADPPKDLSSALSFDHNTTLLIEGPKKPPLTDYDRSQRLRAIDILLSIIKDEFVPLNEEAKTAFEYRLHNSEEVENNKLVVDLDEFGKRASKSITKWYELSDEYLKIYDDSELGEAIKSPKNLFFYSDAAAAMAKELKRMQRPFEGRVGTYLVNNKMRFDFEQAVKELNEWIVKKRAALSAVRNRYTQKT